MGPKARALGVRAGHYMMRVGETEIAHGTSKEAFASLPELSKRPLVLTLAAATVPKEAKAALEKARKMERIGLINKSELGDVERAVNSIVAERT